MPKEVGKQFAKIKIENTLFSKTNEHTFDWDSFNELGFNAPKEILIEVKFTSENGRSILTAHYNNQEFVIGGDPSNNLKALSNKLISMIAEYILNEGIK